MFVFLLKGMFRSIKHPILLPKDKNYFLEIPQIKLIGSLEFISTIINFTDYYIVC